MADRSVVVRLIADTSQYSNQMRNAAQGTRDVGDAGEETQDSLKGLKSVLATVGAGAIIKTGVEFNAMKERAQAAFTTLSGSAKDANAELVSLQRDFGSSPFGFETIIQAGQRLTAMGVPLQDLNKMLLNISDATAAVGGNGEVFDRISMSLGQMLSKGTVQSEEMLQLAEAGIPAWQLLAKEIGVSVPEAMKQVQNRQVSAKTAVDALMKGIQDRFGGATKNAGDTWSGMLARLKAETTQAAGEIVQPLMRLGTEGAEAVRPLLHVAGEAGNAFAGLPSPMQNTALAIGAVALFSGRLNSAWAGLRGGAAGATGGLRSIWMVGQGAANSMQAFGLRAIAAGDAARNAGRAALGAFGGPLGLALTAGVLGLSLWQSRQQQAAAAVEKHKREVEALSSALDKNTLSLDRAGQAEQIDSFLTKRGTVQQFTGGASRVDTSPKFVEDKSIFDFLQRYKINADLARQAILGNRDAMAKLKSELASKGALSGAAQVLAAITGKANDLTRATDDLANRYRVRIPEAARTSGISVQALGAAINKSARDGTDLGANLRASGASATQAASAVAILAANTSGAAGAARGMAYDFAAARDAIAQSASGFVNPTGAWDAAVQANTPVAGEGAAKRAKQPQLSDDPAYRRAKKAADEQRRAMRDQRLDDKDRVRGARAVAKADAEAAAAATKRAAAIKKAADEAKKASDKAKAAVADAQKQKQQADRNAADAAALAAAIKEQSGRAGSMDRGAWARAQATANLAARSTAGTAASAGSALTSAKSDAAAKAAAQKKTADEASRAADAAKAAKARADESKRLADTTATFIENRQARQQRKLDALLKAQEKAQQRFEKRSQASAAESTGAVAGSYSSMAKNVKVSLGDYLKQLRKQVSDQRQWKSDLLLLAAKIPPGMAAELAKLGPQAAPLIRQLATGSKAELREFVSLFGQAGTDAGTATANQLTAAFPLIGAAAASAGSGAATKLANAIRSGRVTVAEAMKNLTRNGVSLSLGLKNKKDVEAYIAGLSRKRVDLQGTITVSTRKRTPIKNSKGQVVGVRYGGGSAQVIGLAEGGWVHGGSGMKDDVRIPVAKDAFELRAMGGEFMVRRDVAQANKGFFNTLNRTGKIPTPAPQVITPRITLPAQAPTRQVINHFAPGSFVQRDGQSVADMYREFDRMAGMGAGPG